FCSRYGFRLPTEAEWEYACRAGTTTHFPWGTDSNGGSGDENCFDQDAARSDWISKVPDSWKRTVWHPFVWSDGFAVASPVGHFRPNAFGLYDMIGNAREWCEDWYDANEYQKCAQGSCKDPQGPDDGRCRVFRGGSWRGEPSDCRVSIRGRNEPSFRFD